VARTGVAPSGGVYVSGWDVIVRMLGGAAVTAVPVAVWVALASTPQPQPHTRTTNPTPRPSMTPASAQTKASGPDQDGPDEADTPKPSTLYGL